MTRDFGIGGDGMIVNGHVPVRVEKGEEPVKQGGHAVTIDGAFSEAYGDRGYTLILGPEGMSLAEHHHFESVSDAITTGADIVPKVTTLRAYDPPRSVADTEEGERIRQHIAALERLANAYESELCSKIRPASLIATQFLSRKITPCFFLGDSRHSA